MISDLYQLGWKARMIFFSFLDLEDVYHVGCCSRKFFMCFLREKCSRKYIVNYNRFLGNGRRREAVALISYPRSGNSYFRKLLETVTNIATGSDNRIHRSLSASLLGFGFQGEGIGDESVWIIKSHFPERMGFMRFPASRILLLVRNPFDAIESYFHMAMTNTHNKSLSSEAVLELQNVWKSFVLNEVKVWLKFYQFWSKQSVTVPTLFLRYEDILENKEKIMEEVMTFLCSGEVPIGFQIPENIQTTLLKRKIDTTSSANCTDITSIKNNNNNIINSNKTVTSEKSNNQMSINVTEDRIMKSSPSLSIKNTNNNFSNSSPSPLPTTITTTDMPSVIPEPGYVPRQGIQAGKSLKQFTDSMMEECLSLTNDSLFHLGYQINKTIDHDSCSPPSINPCYSLSIESFHPVVALDYLNSTNNMNPSSTSTPHQIANTPQEGGVHDGKWVVINEGSVSIREKEDKFGREISSLRKEFTDNDRKPFPTL